MNNIEEGNKIIAEFMGKEAEPMNIQIIHNYGESVEEKYYDFKYHSDWAKLMPVVEKIEGLGYIVYIQNNECEIIKPFWNVPMGFEDETKISATWYAVTQFITWYNKQ